MELLVSTIISLIIQGVKQIYKKWVSEEWQNFATLSTLVGLSFIAAWAYYYLKEVNVWESFYQIGLLAAGIYAVVIKRFEK